MTLNESQDSNWPKPTEKERDPTNKQLSISIFEWKVQHQTRDTRREKKSVEYKIFDEQITVPPKSIFHYTNIKCTLDGPPLWKQKIKMLILFFLTLDAQKPNNFEWTYRNQHQWTRIGSSFKNQKKNNSPFQWTSFIIGMPLINSKMC